MMLVVAVLRDLGPYAWFLFGTLFLIAEALLPGLSLIWFGLAASLTGVLLFLVPLAWEGQMIAFLSLSGATVLLAQVFAARRAGDHADRVNRGAVALIGRELSLAEPIVDGYGRAKVGDSLWRVAGPDLPADAKVRVVGVEGATLSVEPTDPS